MIFAVSILFESTTTGPDCAGVRQALLEERILLFQGESEDEASEKAVVFSKRENFSYISASNTQVTWLFKCILAIYCPLNQHLTAEDGHEIFSRFLRTTEAESLMTPFE